MSVGGTSRMIMALGVMTLFACTPPKIPKVVYSEPSGRDIYMTYCAGCHGEDGKGNLAALGGLPDGRADLTGLSKRNGGKRLTDYLESIQQH